MFKTAASNELSGRDNRGNTPMSGSAVMCSIGRVEAVWKLTKAMIETARVELGSEPNSLREDEEVEGSEEEDEAQSPQQEHLDHKQGTGIVESKAGAERRGARKGRKTKT